VPAIVETVARYGLVIRGFKSDCPGVLPPKDNAPLVSVVHVRVERERCAIGTCDQHGVGSVGFPFNP